MTPLDKTEYSSRLLPSIHFMLQGQPLCSAETVTNAHNHPGEMKAMVSHVPWSSLILAPVYWLESGDGGFIVWTPEYRNHSTTAPMLEWGMHGMAEKVWKFTLFGIWTSTYQQWTLNNSTHVSGCRIAMTLYPDQRSWVRNMDLTFKNITEFIANLILLEWFVGQWAGVGTTICFWRSLLSPGCQRIVTFGDWECYFSFLEPVL